MTSLEKLENLIRLFHEKKTVERIALSGGDICVYNWQYKIFEEQLKSLHEDSFCYSYMIKEAEYSTISPQDAIQIAFICIMARIDHFKLLQIYEVLPVALRKVKGELSELAEKIGVSHEFIRRNESKKGKKSFSVDTVWKISVALNIQPGKLFEIDLDELIQQ